MFQSSKTPCTIPQFLEVRAKNTGPRHADAASLSEAKHELMCQRYLSPSVAGAHLPLHPLLLGDFDFMNARRKPKSFQVVEGHHENLRVEQQKRKLNLGQSKTLRCRTLKGCVDALTSHFESNL